MPPSAQPDAYRSATTEAAWVDRSSRGLLKVTGPDRVSFVQGMVTNDVSGDAPVYCALLTPKGHMVAEARVVPSGEALLIETASADAVLAHLSRYLISEEAELALAPELGVLGLLGPKAQALPGAQAVMPGLLGFGLDLVFERPLPTPPLPRVDEATYEVLRVEAGVPRWGAELTEATIPLEANLERALHYQKGCYIGQEVIARATYRGQMAKRLTGLLLGEPAPEVGASLSRGEKKVGQITSVVRSVRLEQLIALAYVHRDSLEPGTELAVAGGGSARVVGLPFTRG